MFLFMDQNMATNEGSNRRNLSLRQRIDNMFHVESDFGTAGARGGHPEVQKSKKQVNHQLTVLTTLYGALGCQVSMTLGTPGVDRP